MMKIHHLVEPYTSMLLAWINTNETEKGQKLVIAGDNENSILQFNFGNVRKVVIDRIVSLPDIFVGLARCSTPYGMFSGGGDFQQNDRSVICALLDIPSLSFLRLPDLPTAVSLASAVFVSDKVYLLGGVRKADIMYCLDIQTLKWSSCASMPQATSTPPVLCSINTTIYACVQTKYQNKLLAYSTTIDIWGSEKFFPRRSHDDTIISAVPRWSLCVFCNNRCSI